MSEEKIIAELRAEYERHLHGMQSGVKAMMEAQPRPLADELKHLRVGINSAMVNDLALVRILMAKGVLSALEYSEAMTVAMREEKEGYERQVGELYATKVTLA